MKKQTFFSSTSSLISPASYLRQRFTLIELLVDTVCDACKMMRDERGKMK